MPKKLVTNFEVFDTVNQLFLRHRLFDIIVRNYSWS